MPATVSADEEMLLLALRRGDRRAEALFFDRFAIPVNRRVHRLLGHDGEHDDVVQMVFEQLLLGARRVRDASRLGEWVDAVTVNVVRKELRRRRVRRLVGFFADPPEVPGRVADPDQTLAARRALELLSTLPVEERLAFVLRDVDGEELAAVAAMLGVSLATAKRRVARGREIFTKKARRDPALAGYAVEGRRT